MTVDQSHSSFSVSDVVCHIVPKSIGMETNYRVLVVLRSVDCMVLFDKDVSEEQVICKTCQKLQKQINPATNKEGAKVFKAPLAACSAEKLRATVVADRLRCKELEKRIKNLQSKIVSVSEQCQ